MTFRLKLMALVICVLVAGYAATASAYKTLSSAVAVTSQAVVPFNPNPLVDDFENKTSVNAWNCGTGTFGTDATCTMSFTDPGDTDNGKYCLQLDYDVTKSGGFSGYFSTLSSGTQYGDMSAFTYLSFDMKALSDANPTYLKVQLKDTSGTKYMYIMSISTSWSNWKIKLSDFYNNLHANALKELAFVFENSQAGGAHKGTIYIDNIHFE